MGNIWLADVGGRRAEYSERWLVISGFVKGSLVQDVHPYFFDRINRIFRIFVVFFSFQTKLKK